ncbi:ABC transporter ATP-binding protein [Streptomyces sp. NPDC059517]|uniref:ABC transporter ATP-binding protein n=1 Tax=Streptomyces sp. NPDC059517 TaxID=3346855 RepID=UPI003673A940
MTATDLQADTGPHTTAPALELRDVSARYGETTVLRDVSLTVRPGRVTALIGPNGAGKTTSLRVASGLLAPAAGQVLVDGADVTRTAPHRRAGLGLCHIPEGRGIYRNLTVRENLAMMAARGAVEEGIEKAAAAFPVLGNRLGQKAGTLSGGEQQMLALSAAHLRSPHLVLVDEPSLGLAPIVVDLVFEFLETLKSEGIALLLVDQYALRSLKVADTAYVLRRGRIAYSGDAATLLDGNMFEQYIGEGAA